MPLPIPLRLAFLFDLLFTCFERVFPAVVPSPLTGDHLAQLGLELVLAVVAVEGRNLYKAATQGETRPPS
jgi:hypothetical protein